MNKLNILQAAFRDNNGTIYPTGPIHDIEQLPPDLEAEAGFVDADGVFLTREEVTSQLHSDCAIQSQEIDMELEKKESEYTISDPQPADTGALETSIHHRGKKIGHLSISANPYQSGKHQGYHSIAGAEISALHRKKGLYGQAIQATAKYVKNKLGSKGLVSEGHWRSEAATGAWNKLSRKFKVQKTPGKEEDAPDFRFSEVPLEKNHPPTTFPKLGITDDRKETPLVNRDGARTKQQLMLHSIQRRYPNSSFARLDRLEAKNAPTVSGQTLTGSTVDHNLSYATNPETKLHEDLHLMFNRVRSKYGKSGAINLATNLFNHLPEPSKNALQKFVSYKYGGKSPHPTQYHEEHLSHLLNYLNSDKARKRFHKTVPGHVSHITHGLTNEGKEFQTHMKRGYQAVRQAAALANPSWTQKVLKTNRLKKSEFEENIDYLTIELEGLGFEDLNKSDLDVAVIPRIVKPFNSEAEGTAIEIKHAFSTGSVKPVILNGKHCKGTALAHDTISNHTWLLKPGSGSDSPAAGVREEKASQARREIAFSKIAQLLGLGQFVPYGDLLLLDGFETACLKFLNPTFVSFKKLKHDKDLNLQNLFSKYLNTGVLYQWAALDYILGQPDRHAGNMMADQNGNIKLIDAGSAFAGNGYNPTGDSKSFVPFYLRVFLRDKFANLSPADRYMEYPRLNKVAERALTDWFENINPSAIAIILNKYGINPVPVTQRFFNLKQYPGKKSDFLNRFFSGVDNENRQESIRFE